MVFVTLSQVSAVGFCSETTEVFVGQHQIETESDCSHSEEEHLPSECGDGSEPCEDSHLEIDLEVDDFVRASTETENFSPDIVPTAEISFAPQQIVRARKEILSSGFARPPPDLPVYLRLGIMRL